MESWHREILELHEYFEAYFLGLIPADDVSRLESALAEDFTMLGPDGSTADRASTVQAVRDGHAHTASLTITITDATLLDETADTVIARYIENHELTNGSNHRWSTVAFRHDPAGPNGFRWLTVHETWVAGTR